MAQQLKVIKDRPGEVQRRIREALADGWTLVSVHATEYRDIDAKLCVFEEKAFMTKNQEGPA